MPLKLVILPAEPPDTFSADQSQVPVMPLSAIASWNLLIIVFTGARSRTAVNRHTLRVGVHGEGVGATDEVDGLRDSALGESAVGERVV